MKLEESRVLGLNELDASIYEAVSYLDKAFETFYEAGDSAQIRCLWSSQFKDRYLPVIVQLVEKSTHPLAPFEGQRFIELWKNSEVDPAIKELLKREPGLPFSLTAGVIGYLCLEEKERLESLVTQR